MRKIIIVLSVIFSFSTLADMEHRAGQGGQPSLQRLTLSRGCFNEADQLGCGHPREDHEYFIACTQDNRKQLSISCQHFFEKLYGNRVTPV
ncbi:MAG: hypothetical protein NDI69_03200 [Bacteriovoracaceae bacterium]|nr:hypothetical protein [Bacteriovoracaceae bacterium]